MASLALSLREEWVDVDGAWRRQGLTRFGVEHRRGNTRGADQPAEGPVPAGGVLG